MMKHSMKCPVADCPHKMVSHKHDRAEAVDDIIAQGNAHFAEVHADQKMDAMSPEEQREATEKGMVSEEVSENDHDGEDSGTGFKKMDMAA